MKISVLDFSDFDAPLQRNCCFLGSRGSETDRNIDENRPKADSARVGSESRRKPLPESSFYLKSAENGRQRGPNGTPFRARFGAFVGLGAHRVPGAARGRQKRPKSDAKMP